MSETAAKNDLVTSPPRGFAWTLIVTGIVGWIAAFALVLERLHVAANPDATLSCDVNVFISCKSVMLTWQAKLFGFPNPLIGLAAFFGPVIVGVAILAGAKFPRWFWNTFMVGITAGFVFVIWLAHEAIFDIGALCPYCMVAWAGMIPMFWHLLLFLTGEDIVPVPIKTIGFFEAIRGWAWVFTLVTELALIAIIAVKFWSQWQRLFGLA